MSGSESNSSAILARLDLAPLNPGAWSGSQGWTGGANVPLLSVRNPASGTLIAQVRPAGPQEYEAVISSAVETAALWRAIPAPKRGEIVRLIGEELRRVKTDLGTLVSLENGKILAEGLGEVQEMIDIADFAVGQARMLYGLTMQSERPGHRMYEQWHPLGVVGILSAFNFPVAVWSWNAFLAAICGNV
ncbi:MAG: aldehyde dehydrogenase family protein, partial [Gammaproteobacteria bacterium]|nr:aldehyde dehydrogenase family protein [Gammaproteobacteria bacterium]